MFFEAQSRRETHLVQARTNTAFIPLRIRVGECLLTRVSKAMVFGTPTDVTMSELLIESLLPANEETASWLLPEGKMESHENLFYRRQFCKWYRR